MRFVVVAGLVIVAGLVVVAGFGAGMGTGVVAGFAVVAGFETRTTVTTRTACAPRADSNTFTARPAGLAGAGAGARLPADGNASAPGVNDRLPIAFAVNPTATATRRPASREHDSAYARAHLQIRLGLRR